MMKKNQFKDRLLLLIGNESVSSFALKCNIGGSTFRKYLTGAMPGLDKVIAIAKAASVNIEWLATGNGPMQHTDSTQRSEETTCNCDELNLKGKGRIFEKAPPFNAEILNKILKKIAEFKGINPNILTEEKEMDVITLAFSLCQPINKVEAKLLCEILQDYQKEENDKAV